jgi:hypothetical protein
MSSLHAILIVAAAVAAGILTGSFQSTAQSQRDVAAVATVQGSVWIVIGNEVWVCVCLVCVRQTLS